MIKKHSVKEEFINSRLDRWFRRNIADAPQSLIEKNLRRGNIKVNNKKVRSSYKLSLNDLVTVKNLNIVPDKNKEVKQKYSPTKKELSSSTGMFIENNDNFAVINKPPGIAVQSGTKSRRNILDILSETEEFKNSNPFTVHRIDKDTTGILIVAKTRKYAQLFTSLFRIRKIHKTYLGIVLGELNKHKGTFIDNLVYYEENKKITLKAITHFTVIDSANNYSLLKLNPETGRKHQLRKQMLLHGHPILGDTKYRLIKNTYNKSSRLMLHAYSINFSINKNKYKFTAKIPHDFENVMNEKYLRSSLL